MLPPFQQKLINWVDGMKISKEHFQALENYFLDAQRDLAALHLTDYNYGLLFDGVDQLRSSSPCQITVDAEKIEVHRCRAITPAGIRIEVLNGNHPHLRKALADLVDMRSNAAPYLYVVITIDPLKRIPSGEPSVDESPFRFPQALPSFRLDIVPMDQLSSNDYAANSLPIARIKSSYNGYEVDHRYIPPCTKVRSITELYNFFEQQGSSIKNLSDGTLLEIMKIVREKRLKEKGNQLSEDIGDLAFGIIQYCVHNIDEYWQILREQPPIYMVLWFIKLARVINTHYLHARNRNNLLAYLGQYTGTTGGQIESTVNQLCTLKYNHLDVRDAMDKILSLTEFCHTLFTRLQGLSLDDFGRPSIIEGTTQRPTNVIKETNFSHPETKPRISVQPKGYDDNSNRHDSNRSSRIDDDLI